MEKNYSAREREGLALIFAVKICHPYVKGQRFTICTHHSALRWMMEVTDPTERLMRWRLRLDDLDFDVKYRKGKCNCQGDCMSRLEPYSFAEMEIDDEIPSFLM